MELALSSLKSRTMFNDRFATQAGYSTRPERNYNVTRKEWLAVVTFTKRFKQYLLERSFTIRTDHAALQWLKKTPENMGQQARWLEVLEEFDDYKVEHRAGTQHGKAGALSRRPAEPFEDCHDCAPLVINAITGS